MNTLEAMTELRAKARENETLRLAIARYRYAYRRQGTPGTSACIILRRKYAVAVIRNTFDWNGNVAGRALERMMREEMWDRGLI